MRTRRWIPPAAAGAVFVVGLLLIVNSPAAAAQFAHGVYHAIPGTREGTGASPVDQAVDGWIDASARWFSFGNPDKLVDLRLALRSGSSPVGTWGPNLSIDLVWTDLAAGSVTYEVFVGVAGQPFESAQRATTSLKAAASVPVPGDGRWDVWVLPRTEQAGRATRFGPFLVDASRPPAPTLSVPAEPPGYRFAVDWTSIQDLSGIRGYELERRLNQGAWQRAAATAVAGYREDQIGNGAYDYRVRALNGAGVPSNWSAIASVVVRAPMQNPGPGGLTYGIHANYTGFLNLWDLSDPSGYATLAQVPADIRQAYTGSAPAIETNNQTLKDLVKSIVGSEKNTLSIAKAIFTYLFDHADYDVEKLNDPEGELQRAGLTLDLGKGICGDLAVLYITLLRIADVPARPVHGYLDNARSGVGGFHMWVEVYVGPVGSPHAWMPVDVSGVTGPYHPESLFAYFGLFNPDYLALGTERNFERFESKQWNTWASFHYVKQQGSPAPEINDKATVTEYETEYGRLFFNVQTQATRYQACTVYSGNPDSPCPNEPGPPGFTQYYAMKGVSKKRIDYGANLDSSPPLCLKVELRYPFADDYGAVGTDASAIFQSYTKSATATVDPPDSEGWVTTWDGTNRSTCAGL